MICTTRKCHPARCGSPSPAAGATPYPVKAYGRANALRLYRLNLELDSELRDAARRELVGKDLACWCPLNQPCHADILLDVANRKEETMPEDNLVDARDLSCQALAGQVIPDDDRYGLPMATFHGQPVSGYREELERRGENHVTACDLIGHLAGEG